MKGWQRGNMPGTVATLVVSEAWFSNTEEEMNNPPHHSPERPGTRAAVGAALAAVLALLVAACGGDVSPKEITQKRTVTREGLTWTEPTNWERGPERNMRVVTYVPGGRQNTECYITVLSGRAGGVEAMGVDMRCFIEAFRSTHPDRMGLFEQVWEGYADGGGDAGDVRARLADIERRGRYR